MRYFRQPANITKIINLFNRKFKSIIIISENSHVIIYRLNAFKENY